MMREGEQRLAFTVPIFEPLPSQYYIRIVSDQVSFGSSRVCQAMRRTLCPVAQPGLHQAMYIGSLR